MSINLTPIDLTGAVAGKSGPVDWTGLIQSGTPIGTRPGKATLRLFNESNCGLSLNLSGVKGTSLPAGGWGDIPLSGQNSLTYTVLYVLAGPSPNTLLGVLYEPGEPVPSMPSLGNSAVGVGGTVSTSTSSALKNDGNGPGLNIIESTPSDQVASSLSIANSGDGFWKILSAGVLRIVLNVVRGNAGAGKASIQLGDSGDATITTVYGSIQGGQAANVGAITGAGANSFDGGSFTTDGSGNLTAKKATLNTSGLSVTAGGISVTGGSTSLDNGGITTDGAGNITAKKATLNTSGLLVTAGGISVTGGSTSLDNGNFTTNGSGAFIAHGTNQFFATGGSYDVLNLVALADTTFQVVMGVGDGSGGSGGYYVWDTKHGGYIMSSGNLNNINIGNLFIGHNSGDSVAVIANANNSGIGFKANGLGGTKIGEFKSNGQCCVSGGNPCFVTTNSTVGFAASNSFDTFDVSEAYLVDRQYGPGVVVCPHGDVFGQCEHDNCHAASVTSPGGALAIGYGEFDFDLTEEEIAEYAARPAAEQIALVGRVKVRTNDESIRARDLVVSDGAGGVRKAHTGSAAWTIGYALHDATNGRVGIYVRPQWCVLD